MPRAAPRRDNFVPSNAGQHRTPPIPFPLLCDRVSFRSSPAGTWAVYARVLRDWMVFLAEHGTGVFTDRGRLKAVWAAALIPDSRLKGFLRCELPVQVLVVDLNRDPVAEP